MGRMIMRILINLILYLTNIPFIQCDEASRLGIKMSNNNCKNNQPCIFLGKALGYELFNESESMQLIKPIKTNSWKSNTTTIYLTISSFRDKLCPKTLYNLFTKATFPDRIHIGLVQQNAIGDIDCYDSYCELMKSYNNNKLRNNIFDCPFKDNIQIIKVDAGIAKGPTWARALGSTMLRDEEFCMQTDSHMDFIPGWDVSMLTMWKATNNEYAILSTYVTASDAYENNLPGKLGNNNRFETPHLCMVTFHGAYGMVRNWGTKCVHSLPRPKMTNIVWGAGLSFSKCHAERKVNYDPHTPYIFDGEEFSRGLRFWTWGYDIYTPHRVYVVHNYEESQHDPNHSTWILSNNQINNHEKNDNINKAIQRLRMLMEMPNHNSNKKDILQLQQSKYGLGDRRTLDQAIKFSGIDTKNLKMLGNYCGNLDYIPFIEHPWGVDYIPKYDNITEEFIDLRDPGSIYFNPDTMLERWEEAHSKWNQENKLKEFHHLEIDIQKINNPSNTNNIRYPNNSNIIVDKYHVQQHYEWILKHRLFINIIISISIFIVILLRIAIFWKRKL